MAKRNVKVNKERIFALILMAGLMFFLAFNFSTTFETLSVLLGGSSSVLLFAMATSAVDLAGIARLTTKETKMGDEDIFIWLLFIVWVFAAIVDIVLTWWWVVIAMDEVIKAHDVPVNVGDTMLTLFPWAVAIMEFAIRVPLVVLVGQYGDRLLNATKVPRSSPVKAPAHPPARYAPKPQGMRPGS